MRSASSAAASVVSSHKTRIMPDHFINDAGTDVTDAFHMYLRPLLGSGMPNEFRLQTSNRVPKVRHAG